MQAKEHNIVDIKAVGAGHWSVNIGRANLLVSTKWRSNTHKTECFQEAKMAGNLHYV